MKSKKSFDKLRGGYYTPQAITEFICKWIINKNTKKILEPSCGDGNFLKAIVERIENLNLNLDITTDITGVLKARFIRFLITFTSSILRKEGYTCRSTKKYQNMIRRI